MIETDWMYDSLTERFGETLGERQKVVDALLIAKAVVGSNVLGNSNQEGITSIARFILDEWGKHSDAEDAAVDDSPVVLDVEEVAEAYFDLFKCGTHTFPEGSRWKNRYGLNLFFTSGEFCLAGSMLRASTDSETFPFIRIDKEN